MFFFFLVCSSCTIKTINTVFMVILVSLLCVGHHRVVDLVSNVDVCCSNTRGVHHEFEICCFYFFSFIDPCHCCSKHVATQQGWVTVVEIWPICLDFFTVKWVLWTIWATEGTDSGSCWTWPVTKGLCFTILVLTSAVVNFLISAAILLMCFLFSRSLIVSCMVFSHPNPALGTRLTPL